MFAFIRYFAAVSFVLVIMAGAFIGVYFRQVATDDLQMIIEQSNASVAQGYVNAVWKPYQPVFEQLAKTAPSAWVNYPPFVDFSKATFHYFEEINIVKLNLYTARGARFLSTNQAEISSLNHATLQASNIGDQEAFKRALQGEVVTQLVENATFTAADGSRKTGALVQSLVPILSDNYVAVVAGSDVKVSGVIEVFHDVSDLWTQLYLFQVIGTGGIILIFLILLATLMYFSRKAEMIIAKQHESNVELAAAKARAESESEEKSKFLANVSHELRTPLNAIIGFSEIIKTRMEAESDESPHFEYVRDIHGSGVHLLGLINDILDYSKAEAGKLELDISEVDISKIVKTSMRFVMPRAESAGVELIEEMPNQRFSVSTDGKKLKQVLLNLLSNAVKFTPEGGKVTVTLWEQISDGSIGIEVRDTGIGIAPKDISKAMAPFGQVDSELSRKYEGTGLGLPLTKKFVELMGGTFTIQSEVGKGTSITCMFPKHAPEKPSRKPAA
jgi:two-component system cell cycle sensor histidine kinase PleC